MTVEQTALNSSLNLVAETLTSRRQEKERQGLLEQFDRIASELIWTYSPAVKEKRYSQNYIYPYLEPGTASTPPIPFQAPEGEVLLHVEGEVEIDITPLIHPDSTKMRKLSICFEQEGEVSSLSVEYDEDENPIEATLPSIEELRKGIEALNHMVKQYEKSDVKRAPQGYSWSCIY